MPHTVHLVDKTFRMQRFHGFEIGSYSIGIFYGFNSSKDVINPQNNMGILCVVCQYDRTHTEKQPLGIWHNIHYNPVYFILFYSVLLFSYSILFRQYCILNQSIIKELAPNYNVISYHRYLCQSKEEILFKAEINVEMLSCFALFGL